MSKTRDRVNGDDRRVSDVHPRSGTRRNAGREYGFLPSWASHGYNPELVEGAWPTFNEAMAAAGAVHRGDGETLFMRREHPDGPWRAVTRSVAHETPVDLLRRFHETGRWLP